MATNVTWNGTVYSIPASGETGWSALSSFLVALGNGAAVAEEMKQAMRVATTTPVTVSDTTDCVVAVKLASAGAVAVTLPAGTDGRWFVVCDQTGDAGTNNITITPNGAETINGSATYVINENRGSVVLAYSATNTRWNVIARYTAGTVMTNPLTTTGDIIYSSSGTTPARKAIGTNGDALIVSSGIPAWSSTFATAKTFTGGVVFNGGGTNLNHYETGTIDLSTQLTGYGSNPAGTAFWTRVGNMVVCCIPAFSGTSNATTLRLTLSANIRPTSATQQSMVYVGGTNNGSGLTDPLLAFVSSAATYIDFRSSSAGSTWTNSGTKALTQGAVFCWQIA